MPRPSIKHVRAAMPAVLVFIATAMDRQYLTDFWHHLARGREIVQRGRILNTDVFTFTAADQPIVDVNWLTQVIYHGLFITGGLELAQLINSLLLAGMAAGLTWLCVRACGSLRLAVAVSLAALAAMWGLYTVRPQTMSLLLFVVMGVILEVSRTRRKLLWLAPLLLMLWTNMHGAFVAGLLLVGCDVIGRMPERRQRMLPLTILCLAALATLASPYGMETWTYVLRTGSRAAGRGIEEWLAPDLQSMLGTAFWLSVAAVAAVFLAARRRPSLQEILLIVVFLPLAARSVRMIAWWVLAMAPIVAERIAHIRNRSMTGVSEQGGSPCGAGQSRLSALPAVCTLGVMTLACAFSLPWLEKYNPLMGTLRPNHRTEQDLANISAVLPQTAGRIFTRLEWGDYFTWSARPAGWLVFMDGRIEIYDDALWQRYLKITFAEPGWQDALRAADVDALVLDRSYHTQLIRQVEESGRWRPARSFGEAVLYLPDNRHSLRNP